MGNRAKLWWRWYDAGWLHLALIGLVAGVVCFYKLGDAALNDWDEAWHAQVASEILSTGDWLTLHYQGQPYFNKPPLTFWLKAVAFRVGGVTETAARFWPAVFGWGSIVLATWFFGQLFDRRVGLLAGLILSSSWLFCLYHSGRSGETDSTLVFFLLLTYVALWRSRVDPRWCWVAGVATALAWLTKGGQAYLPWLAAAAAWWWERARPRWSWRHVLGGLALAWLLTLPWQLVMLARHGHAFVSAFYVGEGLRPVLHAPAAKPAPVAFYASILNLFFQPWAVLATAVLGLLWTQRGGEAGLRWTIVWAGGTLAIYTATASKMLWYAAPALPAVAALAAVAALELGTRRGGWVWLVALAGISIAPITQHVAPAAEATLLLGMAVLLAGWLAWMPLGRSRWQAWGVAIGLAVPLALHFQITYDAVARGDAAADWARLRTIDEPWREVSRQLANEEPARAIVLVDMALQPAAYFYLTQLHAAQPVKNVPLADATVCTSPGAPVVVVTRLPAADQLLTCGFSEKFRAGGLVVLTPPVCLALADDPAPPPIVDGPVRAISAAPVAVVTRRFGRRPWARPVG